MKSRCLFFVLILLTYGACTNPNKPGEWIKADVFLNPPVDYQSAPFYALNDQLDTTELIRQINGFKMESIYLAGGFEVAGTPSVHPFTESQKYRDKSLVVKPVYTSMSQVAITKENTLFETIWFCRATHSYRRGEPG